MSGDAPLTRIIANARIRTGDPGRPWATALAFRGETLAAIGQAAEILKMARSSTQVTDARGQVIELPVGATVGAALHIIMDPAGGITLRALER